MGSVSMFLPRASHLPGVSMDTVEVVRVSSVFYMHSVEAVDSFDGYIEESKFSHRDLYLSCVSRATFEHRVFKKSVQSCR